MRVRAHIATSAVLGGALYFLFRSVPVSISALLSGVLIDLDHVLEGYINFGGRFNIWHTIKIAEACEFKKLHLFLHSYELLLIISVLMVLFRISGIWLGICAGLLLHIILDSIFNELYPNGMFLIKRWQAAFEPSKILDVEQLKKKRSKSKAFH